MKKIILSNDAQLYNLTPQEIIKIRKDLTISHTIRAGKKIIRLGTQSFFKQTSSNSINVPIGYHEWSKNVIDLRFFSTDKLDIKLTGSLRDYQQKSVNKLIHYDIGLIQAPTGSGKTLMMLGLLCSRHQPTLILVTKRALAQQFMDKLRQFTNYKKPIGMLGESKQKIYPVTVGLFQTVSKIDLTEINQTFGQIIVDEVHQIGPNTYLKTMRKLKAKYKNGFSGTIERTDGLDRCIYWASGPTRYNVNKQAVSGFIHNKLDYKVINTDFYDWEYLGEDYSKLLTNLSTNSDRNKLIANEIRKYSNKYCLIMCDRKIQAQALHAIFPNFNLIIGSAVSKKDKKTRKNLVKDKRSIITTYSLFTTGIDIPWLEVLFLCSPIASAVRMKQVLGRMRRRCKNKQKPVVVDFLDKMELFKRMWRKRRKYI